MVVAEDEYTVYISDIHFVGMCIHVRAGEPTKAAIETSDAMKYFRICSFQYYENVVHHNARCEGFRQ